MRRVLNGKQKPKAIVFVDEIEKSLGAAGSDTSGVSQDQLGQLLSWMQDHRATGTILVGPPGAAKSAVAKAAGSEGGIPTIQLDLGGTKGSLVGQSEGQIREALKVIDAISGGETLWIATCNSLTDLPPELKRRFKLGTWFFDLPDAAERKAIWALYAKKFGHTDTQAIKELTALEWTGAEIESCCEIADSLGITLRDASEYIVPVAKQAPEAIARLRQGAEGRFLSASAPGPYRRYKENSVRELE
jgi:SpoVK/Ycf46/Vps4 family AAA+-type ATPase